MRKIKRKFTFIFTIAMVLSSILILPTELKAANKNQLMTTYSDSYINVTFKITSSWTGAFNANVTIKNISNKIIDNWALGFTMPYEITNIWSGVVKSKSNGNYIIKNDGYNQDIAVGKSVDFGFTAKCNNEIIMPNSFNLLKFEDALSAEDYSVNFKVTKDWKGAFNGEIKITNKSNETFEDWKLEFDFNYQITEFWTAEITKREGNHYHIKNAGYNANIKPGESLVLGFSGKPGSVSKSPYNYLLTHIVSTPTTIDNDLIDTDLDGLTDYTEKLIGTNIALQDTDGDGLTDGQEYYLYNLNPLKIDTDENGINDGDEDIDLDGLSILKENSLGTNALIIDSDFDGLNDGDEYNIHHTKPLIADTDDDGISDGDEVALGFDPLSKDSDGNGIPDNEEKIEQTLVIDILEEENPVIKSVSLLMEGTGNIYSTTTIENISKKDTLTSGVVGLIGAPIEITSKSNFEEATITFSYDESLLGDTKEEDLRVMWYDNENNQYVIMDEETVNNIELNTVSFTTPHFSTYLVVDRKKWYDVWSNAITFRREPKNPAIPKQYFDFCYVIDCSSSMDGASFTTLKKAVKNFVDAMYSNDRGAIIGFNSSVIIHQGFTSDKTSLDNVLNSIVAKGRGNGDWLKVALNLYDSTPKQEINNIISSKMIILISDGDIFVTDKYLQKAIEKGVIISPVLIGSSYNKSILQKIADKTGGTFYITETAEDMRKSIFGVQEEIIGQVDLKDTDGDTLPDIYEIAGMIMPNGQYIYTDPQKKDTDGDGLTDAEEMGVICSYGEQPKLKKIELTQSGFDSKIYAEYFDYKSNPTEKDTDFDFAEDLKDATPLVKNKKMNYVFYEKGGDNFLAWEASDRTAIYMKEGKEVSMYSVNTLNDFKDRWNNMGLDNNKKIAYQIGEVVTIFHGSPNSISINDSHKITTNNSDVYNITISSLDDKRIDLLRLSSCNNGNLDFLSSITIGRENWTNNVAIEFMKVMPDIKEIQAWDGVASYIPILEIEYASPSMNFNMWSQEKNGYLRKPTGLITYFRNGSKIDYKPNIKYEILIKHMPDSSYQDMLIQHDIEEMIK